jgi:hypothetical protein
MLPVLFCALPLAAQNFIQMSTPPPPIRSLAYILPLTAELRARPLGPRDLDVLEIASADHRILCRRAFADERCSGC